MNNSQYSIAVCDDTASDREEIVRLTETYYRDQGVGFSIRDYESATSLLAAIESGERFHLLILDVMMDNLDGIGLAAVLRSRRDDTAIVFVSLNREMALQGYEVAASRYLSKPLDVEKFHEALSYCYQNFQESREILVPTVQGGRRIAPLDILYVEAGERGTKVFLPNEKIDTSLRIFEQEAMLPQKQFVLCHRAFIVNLAAVKYIRRYELELHNGMLVPVSKYRFNFVKDRLIEYLRA